MDAAGPDRPVFPSGSGQQLPSKIARCLISPSSLDGECDRRIPPIAGIVDPQRQFGPYNIAEFHWRLPLIYCPSSGRYGDSCLAGLDPGQSVDLSAFVLSFWMGVDLRVGWVIFPLSNPFACLEGRVAVEIPGTTGLFRYVSHCFGTDDKFATTGNTNSIEISAGGDCLQVTRLSSSEPNLDRARVTRLGCCDDPIRITASGTTFNGWNFGRSFNFVNTLAPTPVAPPTCQIEPMFVGPAIVTVGNGATTQLTPRDADCNEIPGLFPEGTTFAISPLAQENIQGVATISNRRVITGGNKPAVVVARAKLPGSPSSLGVCMSSDPPLVQVVPMTLYLNFPAETIAYLRGAFPGQGLGLNANEVTQVKDRAVSRVQKLFNDAGANVNVVHQAPAQLNNPAADQDGVVMILVVPAPGEPTRRWNDNGMWTLGQASFNDLNWANVLFGSDTEGFPPPTTANPNPTPSGVFINRLPLIMDNGLRVLVDEIGVAIGNIVAHEAAHALGAVPDPNSQLLRDGLHDERFGGVTFNQIPGDRHSPDDARHVMSSEVQQGALDDTPTVLSTDTEFREMVAAYLRAILPR